MRKREKEKRKSERGREKRGVCVRERKEERGRGKQRLCERERKQEREREKQSVWVRERERKRSPFGGKGASAPLWKLGLIRSFRFSSDYINISLSVFLSLALLSLHFVTYLFINSCKFIVHGFIVILLRSVGHRCAK